MDRKEKNELKKSISEHIDLGNGRYKDEEIETLHALVEKRDEYNGRSRDYHYSYKTFDRSDTYRVEETYTYTFKNDESGIHIDRDMVKDWDDGQRDTSHERIDTGRGILKALNFIFRG